MIPIVKGLSTVGIWVCVLILFMAQPELPKALVTDGVKGFFFIAGMAAATSAVWNGWGKFLRDW